MIGGLVLGNFDNESDLPDGGRLGFGDGRLWSISVGRKSSGVDAFGD